MINTFLIPSFDWKIAVIIIVGILVLFILFHLLYNKLKNKGKIKKDRKKFTKQYSNTSKKVIKISKIIIDSKRYNKKANHKFKSYSSKERKKIRKYLLNWMEKVPIFIELNHKSFEKKYKNLHIAVTKDPSLQVFDYDWAFKGYSENMKVNAKKNVKSLINFMNKTKATSAILEVVVKLYDEEKIFETITQKFSSSVNHRYATYYVARKKIQSQKKA